MAPASAVFSGDHENAAVVYGAAAVLAAGGGWQFARGDLLWAAFAAFALALAFAPTLAARDPFTLVPGEFVAVAAVPVVAGVFGAGPAVTQAATYAAVAALALLFTVELTAFTPVEMPLRVAVPFVVLSAMAVAGAWMVVQWLSDVSLGTTFVRGVPDVMWEFAVATGVAAVTAPALVAYVDPDDALGGDADR